MEQDQKFIREAIKIANDAVANGNHPFGALLVDSEGNTLLTAENRVTTAPDYTAHAETELVRKAGNLSPQVLGAATLYTSTEPCVMCSGAICWAGISRVVFACREEKLHEYAGDYLSIPCREVFSKCAKKIEVIGPLLEEEAVVAHSTFWKGYDAMQRKHCS